MLDIVICKAYFTLVKNKLKNLRLDKDLTQESLAEACDVSRQTIISIETGKYEPSTSLALKIAKKLRCRVEDIFYLEEKLK